MNDQINVDPLLLPLTVAFSASPVRPLQAESPAVDAADPFICPERDQRGQLRGIDGDGDLTGGCDIGAYERPGVSIFRKGFEN